MNQRRFSDEVEDHSHVTIVNIQDIMHGNVHYHDTEECPTLLINIQEKRNQNNQNVQWISTKARDDRWNINIVTHGGTKIENDTVRQEPVHNQWVNKNNEPMK
jgi:hypothetical protein